jgi:hypothetical protein
MEYQLMRVRNLIWSLSMVLAMALVACGGGGDNDSGKLRVVASTTQIGDFAFNVGGDHISLTVLLKPNQDAHDFQPKPSQVTALDKADVILRNGIGLDTYVVKATADDAKIAVVTQGISLRDFSGEAEGDADAIGEAAGHDPHIWFSATNAQRMVGRGLQCPAGDPRHGAQEQRGRFTAGLPQAGHQSRLPRILCGGLRVHDRRLCHTQLIDPGAGVSGRRGADRAAYQG